MILGEAFVWVHIPKCGGTFVEKLIRHYFSANRLVFDAVGPDKPVIWHQPVWEREELLNCDLSSKTVVANFRRLPYWILSQINFERQLSQRPINREEYTQGRFYDLTGDLNQADRVVQHYQPDRIDRWIRQESMEQDFKRVFEDLLDISRIDPAAWEFRFNQTNYNRNLAAWFTSDELTQLYQANPHWQSLEIQLYGNLLQLESRDFRE